MSRCLAALLLALASLAAGAAERHSVLYGGERIEVVDRGGLAIWQGDIVVGTTAELLEITRKADLLGAAAFPSGKGTGVGAASGRWPRGASGLFEIPYVVEEDPQGRVPPAIDAFNQLMAGMFRAVPRTTQSDYVAFAFTTDTGPCFSNVGRIGGRQVIGGARNCAVGTLLHEIGHALGLFHEQERGDRRDWITLDLAAVDPEFASNYVGVANQRDICCYDYGSIMHYAATGFTKFGGLVMESVPPGIPFGQRAGYSRGDIDTLKRLYGLFDATIVVDTFPSGLAVIVDGVSRVTPASFTWPMGSTHTLDVPAGSQTLDGEVHVFARWSSDAGRTLAPRQTITINPGTGTVTEPAAFPAVSVYTANFARMKEVRLNTSGNRAGVGGAIAADPPPAPVAGVAGAYYRERQLFTLTAMPNAGASFGRWNGSYFFAVATSTPHTAQMRGPFSFSTTSPVYEFNALFVDVPLVTVRARSQDGDVFGISGTVTRAGNGTSRRLPYATVDGSIPWPPGEAATINVPATATPFATSVRYSFVSLGGASASTATLTQPAAGQPATTLVALYNKQYEPYRQVVPSCAGTLSVGANTDGWVDAGATMSVSLTPTAGWVLAGWRGSLSGTGNSRTLVANDVPDLVAEMNVVPTPLAITEVRPASATAGSAVTLEILGQGFSPDTRVFVAGSVKTATITANRIVVPLSGSDFPASGKAVVTVQNRPGATGSCALNVSSAFDVMASASQAAIPSHDYSDLWWNASEPGWGLNLIQHASHAVFGVMYTYDENRKPLWLVMPGGSWTTASSYSGNLYRVTGPAFSAATFNPASVYVRPVGTATLDFSGRDSGTFTFSVDGRQVAKQITRQPF